MSENEASWSSSDSDSGSEDVSDDYPEDQVRQNPD